MTALRRTINIWWMIGFVVCVLIAFFVYSNKLSDEIETLQSMLEQEKIKLAEMRSENADLEAELNNAGTEAFVENQARDLYGYMMPDEIRFVLSNPQPENSDTSEIPSP